MSRIGVKPITIPAGVEVTVDDNNLVKVKGPKGELENSVNADLEIKIEDGVLTVTRPTDDRTHRAQHGLARTLIHNMVVGVTDGFQKKTKDMRYDDFSGAFFQAGVSELTMACVCIGMYLHGGACESSINEFKTRSI